MFIRLLTVQTTTLCTLRCKKCIWDFPAYKPPRHSPIDLVAKSFSKVFEIYDRVNEFRLAGAEAFLHPDFGRFVSAAAQFSDRYDYLCVVTNGTYIPKTSILEQLSALPFDKLVRVDDYGELSPKAEELAGVLASYHIPCDYRSYKNEDSFLGGWIDLGDFSHKGYDARQLKDTFEKCRMPQDCHQLWDGVLVNCPFCWTGHNLGRIPIAARDFVDLFDPTMSVEEKRDIVSAWEHTPFLGCEYCNGYHPDHSPRIPAAEQI